MNHEDSSREDLFADPEDVVTFAQAYFATEFPNDKRFDCPPVETLRATARSGALPDTDLRAHLFKCSECFRSYRSARMGQRPQPVAESSWWSGWWPGLSAALSGLTSRHAPVAIGAMCLALFGIIAAMLAWNAHHEALTVAVNNPPQARSELAASSPETRMAAPASTDELKPLTAQPDGVASARHNVAPQRTKAITKSLQPSPVLRIVEINLREDGLLRGGDDDTGGKPQRIINLSPTRQRLRLQMPEGSAGGHYTVSIVDAFGTSLVTAAANSNGKTLVADLDLRSFTTKKYRLCLARNGEAPDCYLVNVSEQPRRTQK